MNINHPLSNYLFLKSNKSNENECEECESEEVETSPRQLESELDIINKKISNLSIHRKEYYEKESKALESEIINIDDTESEQKLKELRFQVEEEILRRNIKHISISEYKELNVFRSNNLKYCIGKKFFNQYFFLK